jgi:hypothetical protein
VIYQIQTSHPTYALRNAQVVVRENIHGETAIEYQGKPLSFTVHRPPIKQAEVVPSKQLAVKLDDLAAPIQKRKPYIPPADHPW